MECQYCNKDKKCKICRNIYFSPEDVNDIDSIKKCLDKYGVAVIKNYIDNPQERKQEIIDWLIDHSDNLTEELETWIPRK
jgi:DNA-binding transcriptional MerR regulator